MYGLCSCFILKVLGPLGTWLGFVVVACIQTQGAMELRQMVGYQPSLMPSTCDRFEGGFSLQSHCEQ